VTYGGASLTLTPWAHEALSFDEMRDLGIRAVDLRCRMSIGNAKKAWTIRVSSWAKDDHLNPVHRLERHHMHGHLADIAHAALDEYARLYAYRPEELVTIASQSGLAVTRA
jgi:hypothetical protein